MKNNLRAGFALCAMAFSCFSQTVSPNPMQWHKVTITYTADDSYSETGNPNPFTERRLDVVFSKGALSYRVPGYFAADGDAGNTGAVSGNVWKTHFSPPDSGIWNYKGFFYHGLNIHAEASPANPVRSFEGSFTVMVTSKNPAERDLRGKGWLEYAGGHYLRFKGNGEYFLKQGPDSPENLLSYKDFDGDFKADGKDDSKVKDWSLHVRDWKEGDPVWAGGKGKGLVGAINYLASKGLNAFSFLTMNIAGDDKNVFPYINYTTFDRIDVSRMDQWQVVLDHGTKTGFFFDIKTQEAENQTLLDKGDTGPHRKLYYRELIARFSHNPALVWNLGEENGVWNEYTVGKSTAQSAAQRRAMAQYFYDCDPYKHHSVLHNGQNADDMYGDQSKLTGWSVQTFNADYSDVYTSVRQYIRKSIAAQRPWAVSSDESGGASIALRLDSDPGTTHANARKNAMWGCYMAGGFGNQWYFGYQIAHSDLTLQDFRSRDNFWDYARHALAFFKDNKIPVWEMVSAEEKVTSGNWALAKEGQIYVVYLKNGGTADLDVGTKPVHLEIKWYNPRLGGALQNGTRAAISGTGKNSIGEPPSEKTQDWAVLVGANTISSISSGKSRSGMPVDKSTLTVSSRKQLKGCIDLAGSVKNVRVTLLDLKGKRCKSMVVSANSKTRLELAWDLSDMVIGMYVVDMRSGAWFHQQKITIQ